MGEDEGVEVIQEQLNWKALFVEQSMKFQRALNNKDPRVADIARVWRAMIPHGYRDGELDAAWKKNFVSQPDMKREADFQRFEVVFTAFWDWADRNNMLLRKEFGDPVEVLWMQVKELARRRDLEGLQVLLLEGRDG